MRAPQAERSPRFVLALALALLIAPTPALACPSCATRDGGGIAAYLLIGAMILVPFVIAAVTFGVIRRLERGR